jgi:hypothetical protein
MMRERNGPGALAGAAEAGDRDNSEQHPDKSSSGRPPQPRAIPREARTEDGRHVIRDRESAYVRILAWRTRDLAGRFSAPVMGLLRERHPGALDGEGR